MYGSCDLGIVGGNAEFTLGSLPGGADGCTCQVTWGARGWCPRRQARAVVPGARDGGNERTQSPYCAWLLGVPSQSLPAPPGRFCRRPDHDCVMPPFVETRSAGMGAMSWPEVMAQVRRSGMRCCSSRNCMVNRKVPTSKRRHDASKM